MDVFELIFGSLIKVTAVLYLYGNFMFTYILQMCTPIFVNDQTHGKSGHFGRCTVGNVSVDIAYYYR